MFWLTMKAFCLMHSETPEQSVALLNEIKPLRQTDPTVLRFLVLIMTGFGMNKECTRMLEVSD